MNNFPVPFYSNKKKNNFAVKAHLYTTNNSNSHYSSKTLFQTDRHNYRKLQLVQM